MTPSTVAGQRAPADPASSDPSGPRIGDDVRRGVRLVSAPRPSPPRAPFVGLVFCLLVAGLGGLLLLNTLLAQGSFTVTALDQRVTALSDREQALEQKLAKLAAPARLAQQAAELGMVPVVNPAFLRIRDGRVLGEPIPARDKPAPQPVATVPASPAQPAPNTEKTDKQQPEKSDDQSASNTGEPGAGGAGDSKQLDEKNADKNAEKN